MAEKARINAHWRGEMCRLSDEPKSPVVVCMGGGEKKGASDSQQQLEEKKR